MPSERRPAWHVCDEFLDPLIRAIEPLLIYNPIDDWREIENAILAILRREWRVDHDLARWWFEFHFGTDTADRLFLRLQSFSEKLTFLLGRLRDYRRPLPPCLDQETDQNTAELEEKRELFLICFSEVFSRACQLIAHLEFLSLMIRPRLNPAELLSAFVPSALQKMILEKLAGRARTADELQSDLNIGRHTLYGGKSKKGGITELMERGLVANSRKVGGYFRPDAPPQAKAY